jgi:CTP synthase (UTP-ammonia lyase)
MRIGIIGDFNPAFHSHHATDAAIQHAASRLGISVETTWVPTPSLSGNGSNELLAKYDGLMASPGSPYESMAGMLRGIEFARTRNWPFVGT